MLETVEMHISYVLEWLPMQLLSLLILTQVTIGFVLTSTSGNDVVHVSKFQKCKTIQAHLPGYFLNFKKWELHSILFIQISLISLLP